MIIAVASAKGGTGKSTLSLNLGGMLASLGLRVCVVDTDPQGSIAHWATIRKQDHPGILVGDSRSMSGKVRKAVMRNDIVLFDTAPTFKKRMKALLDTADRLIIPVSPGMADFWSTERLIDMYLNAKEKRPRLDARLVISRIDRRTRAGKTFRDTLAHLNIPIFMTEIAQRSVYSDTWIEGKTLDTLQPGSDAARELHMLTQELINWLKNSWRVI